MVPMTMVMVAMVAMVTMVAMVVPMVAMVAMMVAMMLLLVVVVALTLRLGGSWAVCAVAVIDYQLQTEGFGSVAELLAAAPSLDELERAGLGLRVPPPPPPHAQAGRDSLAPAYAGCCACVSARECRGRSRQARKQLVAALMRLELTAGETAAVASFVWTARCD